MRKPDRMGLPHFLRKLAITIITLFILFPATLKAQLFLGQYEDEAPLMTWNLLGPATGSITGMGNVRFTNTTDCSAVLTNPALISKLPKLTLTFNSSIQSAQLNKYGFINTGLLHTEENSPITIYAFDLIGISYNFGSWGIAVSMAELENYSRPTAKYESPYQDNLNKSIEYSQKGLLRNLNLSLSKQFNSWISAGIGINFVKGSLERNWEDKNFMPDITITDYKHHDINGYYINGGLIFNISKNFMLATIFRSPYTRKADSESRLRNFTPAGNTDISIEISHKSSFKQPLVLGAGFNYRISNPISFALDVSFFNWENYKVDYFGEELNRNFKNTVIINAGIEYMSSIKIFNYLLNIPAWAGFSYDPQPMKKPASKYHYFTTGLGVRGNHFFLDLGFMFGFETGSGDNLKTMKATLTLGFRL